jgi:hypothetical protein
MFINCFATSKDFNASPATCRILKVARSEQRMDVVVLMKPSSQERPSALRATIRHQTSFPKSSWSWRTDAYAAV